MVQMISNTVIDMRLCHSLDYMDVIRLASKELVEIDFFCGPPLRSGKWLGKLDPFGRGRCSSCEGWNIFCFLWLGSTLMPRLAVSVKTCSFVFRKEKNRPCKLAVVSNYVGSTKTSTRPGLFAVHALSHQQRVTSFSSWARLEVHPKQEFNPCPMTCKNGVAEYIRNNHGYSAHYRHTYIYIYIHIILYIYIYAWFFDQKQIYIKQSLAMMTVHNVDGKNLHSSGYSKCILNTSTKTFSGIASGARFFSINRMDVAVANGRVDWQ